MNDLFLADPLHGSSISVADNTLSLVQLFMFALITQELADISRDDGAAGLKIVTTLMDVSVTLAAKKYLQALIDLFGRHFLEAAKTDIALTLHDIF